MTPPAAWTVPAVVLDVHDGDTIRVRADLGWHVQIDTLIRIDGINAPELNTAEGKAAQVYLASLLPVGAAVTVVSKKLLGAFEKYGRVLAAVTVTALAGPTDVAAAMIAAGHAKPWDGTGTRPV